MPIQNVWLKLHQWIGLAGAVFILIMGFTGSALVFENEIDRMLNPSTSYVTPRSKTNRTLPSSSRRACASRFPSISTP